MKKKRGYLVLGLLAALFVFTSCKLNVTYNNNNNSGTTEKTKYTVTFNSNGGTAISSIEVEEGSKLDAPADPTKAETPTEKYTFDGWYKDAAFQTKFNFDTDTITSATTLYAKWDAINKYIVTFDSKGGTTIPSQTVAYGELINPVDAPTKAATALETYTFAGWYIDAGFQTAFNPATDTISGTTTLYAKWDAAPVEFTVTFNTNGGTTIPSQTVAYGELINPVDAPTKAATAAETYTFAGWYKDVEFQSVFNPATDTITGTTTLYAKWDAIPAKYTVTFNTNGGSIVDSVTVEYGSKIQEPTTTRNAEDGKEYVVIGWYKEVSLINKFDFENDIIVGTTTLYAKWDLVNKYTVTFDSKGGTEVASQTVLEGELLTKPTDPTKKSDTEIYVFAGWYEDELYNNLFDFENDTIGESIILYAKWEVAETITITYRKGSYADNEVIGTQSIIKSNDLLYSQLEAPGLTDYRFVKFMMKTSSGEFDFSNYASVIRANSDRDIFVEYEFIDRNSVANVTPGESSLYGMDYLNSGTAEQQANFYQAGYVTGKIGDFKQYENTSAYVQVSTAEQLIQALENAQNTYTSQYELHLNDTLTTQQTNELASLLTTRNQLITDGTTTLTPTTGDYTEAQLIADLNELNNNRNNNNSTWKKENPFRMQLEAYVNHYLRTTINQALTKAQTVHVIEITNDIDLGYYKLSAAAKASSIVSSFSSKYDTAIANGTAGFYVSSMLKEYGVSQINISRSTNLLIYSKNGAKLTHGGFKVTSCDRVVFRNLEMDELWQWEDSASTTPNFTVGDMDVFGWAYFKISFCGYIWIDHCTFGKAYDGIIDVSNPYFYSYGTASSAPYGKPAEYDEEDSSGVHISNCKFQSGSDSEDGYLYKMMAEIEEDYQKSLTDTDYAVKCLYYKKLRDVYKLTFEEILYGIAIPHKKAFLLGDSSESKKAATYHYNQHLKVSLANNIIIDIEDRIPNVRGGIAYLYNTVVDNSRYYKYRQILISKGAKNISAINSKYKLALVSQGILGGYGASIYAENCIFIGIESLVKNNNKEYDDITTSQMAAGFNLVNCVWYNDAESTDYTRIINTIDNPNQITTSGDYPITVASFSWHNESGQKPFNPALYETSNLTKLLLENQNVGVNANYADLYLITSAE